MSERNASAPMPGGYEVVASNGADWKLVWDGPGVHKELCAWAKARARQRATEEGAESLKQVNRRIWAGAYDWNCPWDPSMMGEDLAIVFDQPEGQLKVTQLLLAPHHGVMSIDEISVLLPGNLEGFSAAIRRCLYPNLRTPATKPGTPPATTEPSASPLPQHETLEPIPELVTA